MIVFPGCALRLGLSGLALSGQSGPGDLPVPVEGNRCSGPLQQRYRHRGGPTRWEPNSLWIGKLPDIGCDGFFVLSAEHGGGQEVELEMLVPVWQISVAQRDTVIRQLAALLHVLNGDVQVRALQGRSDSRYRSEAANDRISRSTSTCSPFVCVCVCVVQCCSSLLEVPQVRCPGPGWRFY